MARATPSPARSTRTSTDPGALTRAPTAATRTRPRTRGPRAGRSPCAWAPVRADEVGRRHPHGSAPGRPASSPSAGTPRAATSRPRGRPTRTTRLIVGARSSLGRRARAECPPGRPVGPGVTVREPTPDPTPRTALVVGATGITGSALVDLLLEQGWEVLALSRRGISRPGVGSVAADLRDPESLATALAADRPTHVFFTAWQRQDTEAENIAVNGGMVRDLLAALAHAPLAHVALVTGLKHYLGPFEAYAAGKMPDTPFHEEEPRLDDPELLLRAGGRALRRRRAAGVHLVGAPLAHRHRPRRRQRHEHGPDHRRRRRRWPTSSTCRSSSPAARPSGTASPT